VRPSHRRKTCLGCRKLASCGAVVKSSPPVLPRVSSRGHALRQRGRRGLAVALRGKMHHCWRVRETKPLLSGGWKCGGRGRGLRALRKSPRKGHFDGHIFDGHIFLLGASPAIAAIAASGRADGTTLPSRRSVFVRPVGGPSCAARRVAPHRSHLVASHRGTPCGCHPTDAARGGRAANCEGRKPTPGRCEKRSTPRPDARPRIVARSEARGCE